MPRLLSIRSCDVGRDASGPELWQRTTVTWSIAVGCDVEPEELDELGELVLRRYVVVDRGRGL
ncbi:hypothetical protein [Streptomyces sp. SPB162]|uniref:hypothetical protein n=1 Tax=Streptomyces sp. SPB162 TaxID=2940560 RepID=UPI0024059944|nr:hypothetical protein [Streptomyces sp. SPB162]